MNPEPLQPPVAYRCLRGAVAAAAGIAIRFFFLGMLGPRHAFLTSYPAVIAGALAGGLAGGLVATILSAAIASFFWMDPTGSFAISSVADRVAWGVFLFSGTMISIMTEAMQRARARATQAEAQVKLADEQSRTQTELRRYRLLAENSRDIILHLSLDDGRLLEANAAAIKAYGYSRDELLSLSIKDLRAAETRDSFPGEFAEANANGILFETLHCRKDGSTFPVAVSSQGAEIDGRRTVISIVRDISEQKRAEDELRRRREWLRVTLTSIGDAVLATDVEGKITFLNPVAAELTGWGEQEALGRPVQDVLRIVNEKTHEPAPDITDSVLRKGSGVSLSEDSALLARNGRMIPIENSAAPIRELPGQVTGVVVVFHDASDKRRAHETLRGEQERLRLALEACNSGIWEWDLDTNRNFWSEELWKIYGLEPHSCTPSFESWLQVIVPEDRAAAERIVREAARASSELNVEFRVQRRDGAERWLMVRGQPKFDDTGRAVRYIGIAVDITARKHDEQALQESESRLRMLGDHLPEAAIYRYRHDPEGRPHFDFMSAGIERITGVPVAELIRDASTIDSTIFPEDFEKMMAAILESRDRLTRFEYEVRHTHRVTGETRWSLMRSTPARTPDGSTVWDGMELDITARKLAEEALKASEAALRESEARHRRLLELAPEALLVHQDGVIVYCNQAAVELYGARGREELLRTPVLDRIHPEYLPVVLERMKGAEAGQLMPVRESCHLRMDGGELAVETTAGPVEWQGHPAILVFIRDITDRKRSEARLRDAQKLESLGVLAGGIAHEFNNLLTGVIGNASLARDLFHGDEPVAALLDRIIVSGEQAARLTKQMLYYSGKGRFVLEPVNLSELIQDMNALIRLSISNKIEVRFDLAPQLPLTEAEAGQIRQLFTNLLLNAAEAIGKREGSILVRTFHEEVNDRFVAQHHEAAELPPGSYIGLEVRDDGCGMDEATKARIFDPFFSTKFVGRGLGLAAVAGIVRGHNGAVMVNSAPHKGSSFTVLLPVVKVRRGKTVAASADGTKRGAGTVVVVDDEESVRMLATVSLQRAGYQVLAVAGGEAAIDAVRRHPGDIAAVILDLAMPGMSGQEMLPELRKLRPGVKVLISSGYDETESMRILNHQPVAGFLQKPYTPRQLVEKLSVCLAGN